MTGWTADEWASSSPPEKAETTIPQGVPCTRSISAWTIRSTTPGKFSSSHDFSMGRSVSRTTSSSVGSCFFTVSVNVLNAEPTAADVSRDSSAGLGYWFRPRFFAKG